MYDRNDHRNDLSRFGVNHGILEMNFLRGSVG
jgi:hypothetical protein